MGIIQDLFSRVLGKIPTRGTLTTPTGDEEFPVAICNEIMGGPFIANNLDDLKEIPVERLIKGCKCTVNEYTVGGIVTPTRTYICRAVPSQKLSISGENMSDYWILDSPQVEVDTAIEYQYAPNYNGMKPAFLSSKITKEAYNAGYGSTEDYLSGDTNLKIWKSEYDGISDKWARQRAGSLGDWGIPVSIDDGYQEGSYSDVRFQWRLTSLGTPARPSSTVNGMPNNEPAGWNDTPDIPEGEDYDTYILTNTLWRISSTKGVYGDLLSEWSSPVIVSTNPNLVRYGIDPYNTDYLDIEGSGNWTAFYKPEDKFRASRETTGSSWLVERIAGESGEYIDYVFKEFLNSYEPTINDKPTTVLGYGINGWRDGVFTVQDGYTLYVSTARKFSNGTISEDWTLPVRYDGKNTIRTIIVPKNNTGHTFKYTTSDGAEVVSPSSITLESKLYEALNSVDPNDITSVSWYRGSVATGTLIPKEAIGVEPNRKPQYGGIKDTELTIFPENVSGNQEFSCKVTFRGKDYIDNIDVIDVTDGIGYQAVIDSTAGYIYKGTESKDFTAYLYENGVDISASVNVTYSWKLNSVEIGTSRSVSIDDTNVSGITVLSLEATLQGVTYIRTEALTDVSDGVSVERQYTAKETITITNDPDTPGNPDLWSTDSTNAIWAIDRYEGGEWNTPYRIKGEKGDPNGAFQKTVYRTRNAGETPAWLTQQPTAKTSGSLTPVDWTDTPISSAPTGSEIYGSLATFTKKVTTESTDFVVDNWQISVLGWSTPFKVTTFPEAGANGLPGTDGYNGWSPKHVVVSDGDRRVLQLNEWINGTGSKPAGEGYYLGATGLVTLPSQAIDIRGIQGLQGVKGNDGVFNPSDFWETSVYRIYGSNGSPYYESWDFRFRKSKNGIVYYALRWYNNGSSRQRQFTLDGDFALNMIPIELVAGVSGDIKIILSGQRFNSNNGSPGPDLDGEANRAFATIYYNGSNYILDASFTNDWIGVANGCFHTQDSLGI
ncbi:hypothetical protein [Tenacibaculum sp.]|uniref:hypothetical protein n=1 Tax=Tenacibaculum sp. TaxID=1906242 RepID=UPI003D0A4D5E